ncbi:hypothetical protein L873DRAFT_943279 [Choiromyces venosus 120613-1]|uniref:F-box domain-containing protein n=1 Tax=Choiromyces venosus 120613-1 TaxID=1336337 RepID=A0A3N4K3Z1_9PEZI|nr:hypothetical protein L873DRAFT_943279 [Choiromyces venosus 120613-1]
MSFQEEEIIEIFSSPNSSPVLTVFSEIFSDFSSLFEPPFPPDPILASEIPVLPPPSSYFSGLPLPDLGLPPSTSPLTTLPLPLLTKILLHLRPTDILALAVSCSTLHIQVEYIIRNLLLRKHDNDLLPPPH